MNFFVNDVEIIGLLCGKYNEITILCYRNKFYGLKVYYEKKNKSISRKCILIFFFYI